MDMLVVEKISKKIGTKTILFSVDLKVNKGDFICILGENGAGKSTLLKILSLVMKPTSGKVFFHGVDATTAGGVIGKHLGVISHHTFLYEQLTAYENLRFYGRMYGVSHLEERIYSVLKEVGLELALNERIQSYSRGMQQRLAIARAMIHSPEILFLDEPHTGLDQQATNTFNNIMTKINSAGGTIIMITHNIEEGLLLANKAIVVSRGRIVYQGTTEGLNKDEVQKLCIVNGGGKNKLPQPS
ncbi:ABC transporter ATP-binding protein [Desulfitobacterium dichloroeliminans]|nr:ABC transporter ATP-binding protein [Desulfitobacterium dichloroeliminans]